MFYCYVVAPSFSFFPFSPLLSCFFFSVGGGGLGEGVGGGGGRDLYFVRNGR